ncbi:protogenin-like isoform X2 [Macrobrachium nipponense]|uniref:protogenin-like isoform X2 n=1 Tax=Macrobrachium nipponense TaxID=159736 RepID=UPI0030C809EC
MAWYSSMSGILPRLVLVAFVLTGTDGSGGQTAAAESELSSGISGSWGSDGYGRSVLAARGSSVVLPCRVGGGGTPTRMFATGGGGSGSSSSSSGGGSAHTQAPRTPSPYEWINVDWRLNNVSVDDRRRYYVTPDGHLNITKVTHRRGRMRASNEGEFQCVVTTPAGVITSPPIHLYVASMTKNFVLSHTNVTVVVGEALRLSCQIDSQPPASLTWTHDEQPLPQDDRYTTPFSGVLHITGVRMTDAGTYKCRATNSLAGKDRRSNGISVTVVAQGEGETYKPPSFLSPKVPIQVIQGDNAVLECMATGVPLPTISWQRKVNIHEGDGWEDLKNGMNGITILGQGTLLISNVYNTSAGLYVCTAKSENPTTKKDESIFQELTLDVMVPPEILDPPKPSYPLLAKTVRLNCSVTGHPVPRVIWYKNGLPIEFKGRIIEGPSNQLVLTSSITSDTGMYQCLAINDAGYASSWAPMLIKSSKNNPDPPKNLRYKVLSSTSVLLEWDPVTPVDEIKAYSVHYSETEGNKLEISVVSSNVSYLLEKLTPNTNYTVYLRAYSTSASDISERITFQTDEDVPTGAPKVRLTPVSPTTLLVTWSKLPPEKAQGTIIGYKIQWRKPNHYYYHVIEVGPNVFEYRITDLYPGKRYEVQVLAGTKMGYPTKNDWPWITKKMRERNPADTLPSPNVTIKVLNDTTGEDPNKYYLKIDWQPPEESEAEIEGYILKYRPKGKPWLGPVNLTPDQLSYTITGLDVAWYEIQLKAVNSVGEGLPSVQEINVHQGSLGNPTFPNTTHGIDQLEVNPLSQTSVRLSWKDAGGREVGTYFMVKYYEVPLLHQPPEPTLVRSDITETIITGLKPFSTYEFSVRAHESEKMFSAFSPPVQATTMDNLPPAPKVFKYEPTDTSTIRLLWDLPPNVKNSLTNYEILFTLDKNKPLSQWDVQEVDGELLSDTVGGLISNTPYYFRIRGCIHDRCGPVTEAMMATIPTVLKDGNHETTEKLYLICGLVATLFLVLILVLLAVYCVKSRNMSTQPRVLACNGNGHINGKRCAQAVSLGQSEGHADIEGQEMEVYIPMLTQIPPDFKSPPLDTKGGYPDPRVNGLNNPRCNGFIRSRDQLQEALPRADSQGGSEEENERLVIGAGSSSSSSSSNGAMRQGVLPQAFQNHHRDTGDAGQGRENQSHSLAATPPPSPTHQHNHSGTSQDGLTNITSLTTLSGVESEGGIEQDKSMVGVAERNQAVDLQHGHHHNNSGATRASSPRPPLTTVQ